MSDQLAPRARNYSFYCGQAALNQPSAYGSGQKKTKRAFLHRQVHGIDVDDASGQGKGMRETERMMEAAAGKLQSQPEKSKLDVLVSASPDRQNSLFQELLLCFQEKDVGLQGQDMINQGGAACDSCQKGSPLSPGGNREAGAPGTVKGRSAWQDKRLFNPYEDSHRDKCLPLQREGREGRANSSCDVSLPAKNNGIQYMNNVAIDSATDRSVQDSVCNKSAKNPGMLMIPVELCGVVFREKNKAGQSSARCCTSLDRHERTERKGRNGKTPDQSGHSTKWGDVSRVHSASDLVKRRMYTSGKNKSPVRGVGIIKGKEPAAGPGPVPGAEKTATSIIQGNSCRSGVMPCRSDSEVACITRLLERGKIAKHHGCQSVFHGFLEDVKGSDLPDHIKSFLLSFCDDWGRNTTPTNHEVGVFQTFTLDVVEEIIEEVRRTQDLSRAIRSRDFTAVNLTHKKGRPALSRKKEKPSRSEVLLTLGHFIKKPGST